MTIVHLPSSCKVIDQRAYERCLRLRQVNWPSGVESVGSSAFQQCAVLARIELPSVVNVSFDAFNGCRSVQTLRFGERLDWIGDQAFYGMTALTAIVLPDSLRFVGRSAFQACRAVRNVSIGGQINYFGSSAFWDLGSLEWFEIRAVPVVLSAYCAGVGFLAEVAVVVVAPMDDFCGVPVTKFGAQKSKTGAIAGGVVGGVAAVAIIAVVLYCIGKGAKGKQAGGSTGDYDAIADSLK